MNYCKRVSINGLVSRKGTNYCIENQGITGVPGLTTGVYCAVGVTARVDERVGFAVGEFTGCCVGLGGGELVGCTGLG